MIILADVVVAGLALATIIFLPLSLICSLTATAFFSSAMLWRRPFAVIGATLFAAFIVAAAAVTLFFVQMALSFALSRGTDNELFRPLFALAVLILVALHILVFLLSRRSLKRSFLDGGIPRITRHADSPNSRNA